MKHSNEEENKTYVLKDMVFCFFLQAMSLREH